MKKIKGLMLFFSLTRSHVNRFGRTFFLNGITGTKKNWKLGKNKKSKTKKHGNRENKTGNEKKERKLGSIVPFSIFLGEAHLCFQLFGNTCVLHEKHNYVSPWSTTVVSHFQEKQLWFTRKHNHAFSKRCASQEENQKAWFFKKTYEKSSKIHKNPKRVLPRITRDMWWWLSAPSDGLPASKSARSVSPRRGTLWLVASMNSRQTCNLKARGNH